MADELRRERDLGTVPSGVFLRHVGTRGRISEWNGRAALQLDWLFLIVFVCLFVFGDTDHLFTPLWQRVQW